MKNAVEIIAFPAAGAFEVLELRFLLQELGRVEDAAAADERDVVHLVQHLVIDDPLYEEARHELAVERGMDADEAILDRVAAHLDRIAALALAGALAPGDARIDDAVEVARVEL